ncbi:MAG: hypothetical protein JRF22_03810 [Deltaproteobacteria bacterium]|nr:hypothetical protein [Deltaproteobacteria bacterium]
MLIFAGLLPLITILSVNGAPQDEVQLRLEQARENLRISQATEGRITSELEQLKNSGKATPEILNDYETYLNRIQAMVNENQKIVDNMEATYSRYQKSAKTTGCSNSIQSEGNRYTEVPAEEEPDELSVLDSELNDSLAEFDEMLLKEMDEIRAKSENNMKNIAGEAAEAAERLREKGVDVSSSEDDGTDEHAQKSQSEEEIKDREQGEDELEQGGSYSKVPVTDSRNGKSRSDDDATYSKQDRKSHGSAQDDDIVARQIREAAEKETDPELKKKLWKEYEDYKRGSN